ncbi:uncharacterized protein [Ptychodera flava]|uniref:uncharacterized protein n=1 Tax=Ptychodera flava TaxID=63121 RepID=UPI00396A229D
MVQRLTTEIIQVYDKLITNQLERGFIEIVTNDDVSSGHYLPHHPVKKNSDTTPIRIIYDCSCKVGNNPSLNVRPLDAGPSLLNDLASIMLRFRMHKFGVSADIEKAFLQVGLEESDRDFTKFMWLSDPDDPNSPFRIYRFKVVLFGAACSPFILNATVKFHLENDGSETAVDLSKNIYVDNVLSGRDSEQKLIDYHTEAINLMKSSGFNLREWATNCAELKEIVAKANIPCSDSIANVLGLRWDTDSDSLRYPDKELDKATESKAVGGRSYTIHVIPNILTICRYGKKRNTAVFVLFMNVYNDVKIQSSGEKSPQKRDIY